MEYKIIEEDIENMIPANIIRTDNDGKEWAIPVDESNSDYQAYLTWVEETK